MNLSYALYTVLHGDSYIEGMVSGRIYPDVVKRHATIPSITYTLDSVTITETKDSTTKWDEVFVTITCFALTRISCEELSGYVRNGMTRKYGVKGTDTWITSNYQGESWGYEPDETRTESADKGRGIYMCYMNFRIVVSDVADYSPGSGVSTTVYIRKGDSTLTLTEGNNTLTHNKSSKLRTLVVSDSTDKNNYMPNWINTGENTATIEWVGATLTNGNIKYSY